MASDRKCSYCAYKNNSENATNCFRCGAVTNESDSDINDSSATVDGRKTRLVDVVTKLKICDDVLKKNASPEKKPTEHIMISYAWTDQKKVIPIKEALKKANYHVWMDVDNMKGSTLEAMAEAVENAAVVLVCMSRGYKDSGNCKKEAEYADTQKKNIIPLRMETGYKPDGWLGIIIGAKLFYDFSGKYSFDEKIEGLIKELGSSGKTC